MSTKIKTAFLIILAVTLLLFFCVSTTVVSYADTTETEQTEVTEDTPPDLEIEPTAPETTDDGEEVASNIEELAERFKAYLVNKYGADYEFYYNQIIEQWGSIEGYLLAFGEKLPEEQQSGWDKFVGWLGEYAPVWAPALAIIVLIIVVLVGKSKIKKLKAWFTALIEKLVNKRLAPIENELNLQSKATLTMLHSQKALFGSAEKFSDNVKELEEAEKELLDG